VDILNPSLKEEIMVNEILEPIELIEPMSLMAEANSELDKITIYCRGPGYICKTGKIEED
jgi:hypothetical protein